MNIRCFVGKFTDAGPGWPPVLLKNQSIEDHLAIASQTATGTPGVHLVFDESRMDLGKSSANSSLLQLSSALRDLTWNSIRAGTVSNIGLILAQRFEHSGTFGMMFDVGFGPTGDRSFHSVPREGAAIFLDSIRDKRPDPVECATQIAFTAIHELGHVFNLWHVEAPFNFLSTSPEDHPHQPGAFEFTTAHKEFLSGNGLSDFVTPGGSKFGSRGPGISTDKNPHDLRDLAGPLRMTVSMTQREFFHFEPVELDITLSVGRSPRQVRLPDKIDPGYDSFEIWIERPDGTRHRYRPTAWFCENPGGITVSKDAPFTRDIPIFGQSGGYTFQAAGLHRLTCTLALGQRVVTSNTLEVYVKPAESNRRFELASAVLRSRINARLQFYKAAFRPLQHDAALEQSATALGKSGAAANVRYNLARALLRSKPTKGATVRRYHETARRLLNRSLDSGALGAGREKKANDCLCKLDS